MNICISYFSKFGNGKQSAEKLSEILKEKGHSVSEVNIGETSPGKVPQADLYVFSSPTRAGQPAGKVMGFIKKGAFTDTAGFGIVSTGMDLSTGALNKLTNAAEKKGLKKASGGVRIKLNGFKGPLEDGYIEKLQTFAAELTS